ncbi:P1 family peptidase [Enterovirga aerilata]|uniref:P1 family peptidase n=1 Tax=Enterovirga aerilata TaxID=2730920 RepID=A0A849I9Y1_9HYPH|nr:P1 family peptidase [Enterovirga sp. DB1703]NNM72880.1 P1 family peptidase [Enterovirga sp. DB1703]
MNGLRNLLTDVPGIRVGNAHDERLASGVTVALFDRPAVASVFVAGGGPAGRDQECLEPDRAVERIDAVVLSGGSGLGLDAATGAQAWLRERGRGIPVASVRVPIVPSAVLFDLLNGGDKNWGRFPPYRELAYAACEAASEDFALGTQGGGYGATTVDLKGGVGSASATTPSGYTVGALACVNAIGSAVVAGGPHFWAAPFEQGREFGGLGLPARLPDGARRFRWKGQREPATTLCLVATDATLGKAEARRLAIMAQGGLAKALSLSHAPMDGDTVFAVSTLAKPAEGGPELLTELGATASDCLARAIARGVHAATALPFPSALPAWSDLFGAGGG